MKNTIYLLHFPSQMILFLDLELHWPLDLLLMSGLYFSAILKEILTSDLLILVTLILNTNAQTS